MFKKRLQRWIDSPLSYKIGTVTRRLRPASLASYALMPAVHAGRTVNSKATRTAIFDTIPADQTFVLRTRGADQFLCLASDKATSRSIFIGDMFDDEKMEKAVKLLGPSFRFKTLVDIGANIGTICIRHFEKDWPRTPSR